MATSQQTKNQKVLLHTCCGPCASACVPRLRELGYDVALFFSNSNLGTGEEFERRRAAAEKLAAADGVELIVDAYDHEDWLGNVAKGLESEPEGGRRCELCFKYNLARTASCAREGNFDHFTTSLTVSPHKNSSKVFSANSDDRFLKENFKKNDGFKKSVLRSAELDLYRQSYCGCEFSRKTTAQ